MTDTVFICGPTAVGKTEYAIRLANELDGVIVSADSMQIYKYMDIGSAKPTPEERRQARHWLVDEIDPRTPFNVFEFQKLAKTYINDIASRGKLPIVSGGTGLYISSLVYDMDFSAPEGDDSYRQKLWEESGHSPERLWERLRSLDSAAADEIHQNNVKRVLRAIERLEKGEENLASFEKMRKPSTEIRPILISLERDRAELYSRIDLRVDKLFAAGLEQEVRDLMDMGFTEADVAMKGIGYKEIIHALSLDLPAESAADEIKQSSRRYAKRQLTWLRHQYPGMHWVTLKGFGFNEDAYQTIIEIIRSELKDPQTGADDYGA
ncbi:MAG: tRNA (adenosine(37)-N6)-dimethylallyltransferase MiaA [Firmicutes bacterium]|nr:tRNA (adenosine(37)-N6)-dimethylallyltransferase MiaA [Bacillota bacterium]